MLKVAIVGVGWAGTRQVEAIRELDRKVAVECLIDNDPVHLAERSSALGVSKTYADLRAALDDPDVDAVSICTPHALHRPMAVAAAETGKHVLCEKPIALTVADATAMIAAAEDCGVKLFVAENVPYEAQSKLLRRMVQSGKPIGEVTSASVVAGFRAGRQYGYPGRRAWLAEPEEGGTGTWMLHGIHTVAGLRYVFGEVETVYVHGHHTGAFPRDDLEGTMSGLLTLESGVSVSVVQTAQTRLSHNLGGYVIHGELGSVRASAVGYELFANGLTPEVQPYPEERLSSYAQEIEAFANYVSGDAEGPTTGRSERRTLAIIEAGYESARTGLPVNIRARFGEL